MCTLKTPYPVCTSNNFVFVLLLQQTFFFDLESSLDHYGIIMESSWIYLEVMMDSSEGIHLEVIMTKSEKTRDFPRPKTHDCRLDSA